MKSSPLIKPALVRSVLFLVLAASGCEKSADLGRMQEETLGIVKLHAAQVDTLQRRADALMTRGQALGGNAPGISEAGRLLSEARAGIDQLRAQITAAGATLGTAAKGGDVDHVERTTDELLDKLDSGEIAIRANLAAVDNWLMSVENRPAQATTPPQQKKDETPVPPPATDSASGAGSGSPPAPAAGSAASSAAPKN